MTELATRIQDVTAEAVAALRTLEPQPYAPGRWSEKQVLGHLIDSAANNHQRIVRGLIEGQLTFPGYEQERWVQVQNYESARWDHLLSLFEAYNKHLAWLIGSIRPDQEAIPIAIGGHAPLTLRELAEDYLRHLRHHLQQIRKP